MSIDNVAPSQGLTSLDVGLVGGRRGKPLTKKARKSLLRHTRKVKKAYKKFLKLARKLKMRGGGANVGKVVEETTPLDGDEEFDMTTIYSNAANSADEATVGNTDTTPKFYLVKMKETPEAIYDVDTKVPSDERPNYDSNSSVPSDNIQKDKKEYYNDYSGTSGGRRKRITRRY